MDPECPGCGVVGWQPLHVVEGHTYVHCATCHTGRLDPLPTSDELTAAFDHGYFDGTGSGGYLDYDGEEAARRANAETTLRRLHDRRAEPSSLIEIGCASGWFLERAADAGWDVTGIELNAEMRRRAAERIGTPAALYGDLDEVAADARFGAAVMVQVLEHLPDPGGAIDRLGHLVGPGGALVIETWNNRSLIARTLGARWQQVTPPSVVWLFSAAGLTKALERRGFTDVTVARTAKRVGIGSVVSLLADRTPVGGGRLHTLARTDRVRSATVPYRLGDLITVTATRSNNS